MGILRKEKMMLQLPLNVVAKGLETEVTVRKMGGGKVRMMLPITVDELKQGYQAHDRGVLIQDAFPRLDADQREFLMTGITPDEWDRIFGDDR